jgi:carboxyl-terminal processing protease
MILHKNTFISALIRKWYIPLVVLFVFACKSDDDTPPPSPLVEVSMNGFWEIPDKGWIFEFTDGNDIFYNVNAAGCCRMLHSK